MSRTKLLAFGIAGILIPVALAFAAFLISKGTLGQAGVPPIDVVRNASSDPTVSPGSAATDAPSNRGPGGGGGATPQVNEPTPDQATPGEDQSGKCDEPEHRNDPECGGSGSGSGESGSGGSGSDNSGPGGGSDNSGPGGGGDDDRSGSGKDD